LIFPSYRTPDAPEQSRLSKGGDRIATMGVAMPGPSGRQTHHYFRRRSSETASLSAGNRYRAVGGTLEVATDIAAA
jgi:hypothetical protein